MTTSQQIRKFFQQQPWWVLFLGVLPLPAMFAIANSNPTLPQSAPATSPVVSVEISPSPTVAETPLPLPSPEVEPAAAQQTSLPVTPTPQASPSPSASPQTEDNRVKPQLTEEEKALNEKAKARFTASIPSVDSTIEMHIAIATKVPSLTISASAPAQVYDQDGQLLYQMAPNTPYTLQADVSGMSMGSQSLPQVIMVDPSHQGLVTVGSRTYRGRFVFVANGGLLWAVNYVNLRQYLYSVVASEVSPSWKMAALKAQAIAARSYALTYYFKPVSSFYHMGADEYYQVYTGIEKEAERTSQAVDETAGEFVSYKGGIVESLYAASDEIVAEAFQGKGMSQLGALSLAEQGYNYLQILDNYYPGTAVSRIKLDLE